MPSSSIPITLFSRKKAEDIPSGAVSYSGVFEFLNLAVGNTFIVTLTTVDKNDNMTSREEGITIADVTAPVINQFQEYSPTSGHLKVDVNAIEDLGGSVVCIAYLYWIFDTNTKLDSYWVELTDGAGSVTFTDLDPERTYIVELFVRDSSWNSRYDNREGYPNGAGVTFQRRRGLVVVRMSGEALGGAAWCGGPESPPRGAVWYRVAAHVQ